nr:tyrosine-type recombinase/integrase [Enterovibrio nigricans]
MAIVQTVEGLWVTTLDASHEFNLKMDALAYENKVALQRKIKASFDNRRLSELIDLWHKLHGKALKDGLRRYKLLYRMAERVNNPIATQFTSDVFAHYRQERANEVSVGTLNREHAYMRAVFNELRRLGVINYENPLTHIRQFKEKEHDLRFLSGSEIQQLLANSKKSSNSSLELVIKVCLATGARWGEAENLKASQLKNGQVTFLDTKGGRKKRSVPISESLTNALSGLEKSGDERLFIGCLGAFRKAVAHAGIYLPEAVNPCSPTLLRQSFCHEWRKHHCLKRYLGALHNHNDDALCAFSP